MATTLQATSSQLQQVPSIKIITEGSSDLKNAHSSAKKIANPADDQLMLAHEAPTSPTNMSKCKSLLNMKNLPKLSLTSQDDDGQPHQMVFDESSNLDGSRVETKGLLLNGKTDGNHLSAAYESKMPYKNFFVGSNNNLNTLFLTHHTGSSPRRLNRKCLSRINLNLYQQQPLIIQPPSLNALKMDASKKMYKKSEQSKNKIKVLNHSQTSNEIDSSCSLKPSKTSNLEVFNRMTKPYSSSSIMNLERVTDAPSAGGAVPASTSSNQILAPNDYVFSSHFRKGSNLYINYLGNDAPSSGGYGLGYLRSSNMNLYKSSTSLNALDLELLDSVSVGSFDRESIYSNYANSECELSNYCLYDPIFYVQPASQTHQFNQQAAKSTSIENESDLGERTEASSARDSKLSNSMASLRINSAGSTKSNSKVISWLQNI